MKFAFSGALYRFVDYSKEVEIVGGGTIGDCLKGLVEKYPAIKTSLLDNKGRLSKTHQLFLNGNQINAKRKADRDTLMDVEVGEDDVVYILTAITGG